MVRLRPGLGSVTMRGRIEGDAAHFVIEQLPWLLDRKESDVYWDLSAITSYSATVPPIMVNGMIKHRALIGRFHMFTTMALLKAAVVGANLTLGSTMVHYGEQAPFEAALAEALRG
jgi:hypothetical protein